NARMHLRHFTGNRHEKARSSNRVVEQREGRIGRQEIARSQGRQIALEVGGEVETDRDGVRIEDAYEISPGVQGRGIVQTDRQCAARRVDQGGLVEISRRWRRVALEVEIQRKRRVE